MRRATKLLLIIIVLVLLGVSLGGFDYENFTTKPGLTCPVCTHTGYELGAIMVFQEGINTALNGMPLVWCTRCGNLYTHKGQRERADE